MGCKQSRNQQGSYTAGEGYPASSPSTANDALSLLEVPSDDYVPNICSLGKSHFAVAGGEGWLYMYDIKAKRLEAKLRAHKKAVNKLLEGPRGLLFTSSADASVRLWRQQSIREEGEKTNSVQSFEGHLMSVSTMDIVDDWGGDERGSVEGSGAALITGSRDCTVRLWDIETGRSLQQHKILRNVVTAVRRVPAGLGGAAGAVVQASEDLQLRLWDVREGLLKGPSMAVRAGPNQLICLDVADDGSWVACGSKGFSRENCEVKVFDIRGGLRELVALPCADQTFEAMRLASPDCCLTASKDGQIRALALPEACVVSERRGASMGSSGYTALGVLRDDSAGPTALAAWAGPDGVGLEMLAWPDKSLKTEPVLLATT
eukprot:TRINITY_DN79916_c0_g1_i1.p1 TRINITY_DN79916_c0_g1~~TRINITY_DN79916_c0_g1_i1.p1  ORF type:complete len:375 (+),score=77.47 TRINITY_DN79916_c0_g1_i1:47-1171(+)